MKRTRITPANTVFIILSFEGPDHYALAGGLGVRVTNLSETLANQGFTTHVFFVGDPRRKGEETSHEGRLILHRWCQWISNYYPNGVYQGENEKVYDFNRSIPPFITERVIKPAVNQDKLVVILGEEWHTAEVMCRISDLLQDVGLKDKVVMFWNANNTYGFDRINWARLGYVATITTVSRYMKQIMWGMGLNPMVVPNGIPRTLLAEVDAGVAASLRSCLAGDLVLTNVARFHTDKRWLMAVEAVARLKNRRNKATFLARGGIEPHGQEVMHKARALGLTVAEARTEGTTFEDYCQAISKVSSADIVDVKFHCPQDFLRVVYHVSDAVLANSAHEPFGLVGLETMAAGGIVFTGGTGEDYAIHLHNCIILETANPKEIEDYVMYLNSHPAEVKRIRRAARETARLFTWEEGLKSLTQKLEYQARLQGLLEGPGLFLIPRPKPADYVEAPVHKSALAAEKSHSYVNLSSGAPAEAIEASRADPPLGKKQV